jgi:hypothetical protein
MVIVYILGHLYDLTQHGSSVSTRQERKQIPNTMLSGVFDYGLLYYNSSILCTHRDDVIRELFGMTQEISAFRFRPIPFQEYPRDFRHRIGLVFGGW